MEISHLPYHKIFPFKMTVLNTLHKGLDDSKRLVRKEAAKTRNEWYVLQS